MSEDGNNFDGLRQLLKLKRHESPPPGYFTGFSSQIIRQIRTHESSAPQTAAARPDLGTAWFSKLSQLFEFKPALAGAFASALCLVLIFGVVYADRPESVSQSFLQNSDSLTAEQAALTPAGMPSANYAQAMISSNGPATSLQPVLSFFGSGNPLVQPASFSPSSD